MLPRESRYALNAAIPFIAVSMNTTKDTPKINHRRMPKRDFGVKGPGSGHHSRTRTAETGGARWVVVTVWSSACLSDRINALRWLVCASALGS